MKIIIYYFVLLIIAVFIQNCLILLDRLFPHNQALTYFLALGIFVHELAHAILAVILGYKLTDFNYSLHNRSGSITYNKYNYYHFNNKNYRQFATTLISIAPTIIGILIVWLIIDFASIIHNILIGSLVWICAFSILSTCLSSGADWRLVNHKIINIILLTTTVFLLLT